MHAAIYLRSSKDRSDVSIDAQRRELQALAKEKGFSIVEEFSDAVESGKDDNRPGFQSLLAKLKHKERAWSVLMAMDTSRIARNQYLAHALHYECEKRNIKIIYSKMPETGSAVDLVIRAVMQAFDQLHSLMSKEKGLSGMAENVKQGFRAGGRAPHGYKLEHIDTGTMRDGMPVKKSKLVFDDQAPKIKKFLELRANGMARTRAAKTAGVTNIAHTSLIGVEWNALTYAGHTVWNVHNEKLPGGGYKGGVKRKPRFEWVINKNTHEAMITEEQAETIIHALENNVYRDTRRNDRHYVLTGLLFSPAGTPYHGCDGIYYRAKKGKRLPKDKIERGLIQVIMAETKSEAFLNNLLEAARKQANKTFVPDNELKACKARVKAINEKIEKLTDMAAEAEHPRPWLEKINKLENERQVALEQMEQAQLEYESANVLRVITQRDLRRILESLQANVDLDDPDSVKDYLQSVVERIELTESPQLTFNIHYRISSGDSVASPRGFEPRSPP